MTMNTPFLPVDTTQLSLNSFRESAGDGEALQVVHDGSLWKVRASAAAVSERLGARSDAAVDTTAIFVDALGLAFSRGIQQAVVRELGLEPKPGQLLESRLVLQAIAMAEASKQALQGVDFMTQLMFSAAAHSQGFVHACRTLGLSPDRVGLKQRAAIDACMQQRFSQAAQQGEFPVAPERAQQWLDAELAAVSTHAPEDR